MFCDHQCFVAWDRHNNNFLKSKTQNFWFDWAEILLFMTTKKLLTLNSCDDMLSSVTNAMAPTKLRSRFQTNTSLYTSPYKDFPQHKCELSIPEVPFKSADIQVSMTNFSSYCNDNKQTSLLTAVRPTVSYHTRPCFDWLSLARVCSIGSNPSKDDAYVHLVSALLTGENI